MENSEFLIDHRSTAVNPSMEDFEDHSQKLASAAAAAPALSSGGGANNTLLLDGEVETIGGGDGTFLVDDDDHQSQPPQSHFYGGEQEEEEEEDDDISKRRQQSPIAAAAAAGVPVVAAAASNSSQQSSSTEDFEFIATPQSTTDREEVKMDNLLDFESHPAAPAAAANLVETLLTGEDLKPHKDSAAAYLENEFTQFSASHQQPQDFNFVSSKPVKDVYSDFMEAERGGRVNLMQDDSNDSYEASPEPVRKVAAPAAPVEEEKKKPIETISSTPIVPPPVPAAAEVKQREAEEHVNFSDADDLLEQFAAKKQPEEVKPNVAAIEKQQREEEEEEEKMMKKLMDEEAKKVPVPTVVQAAAAVVLEETKPKQQPEPVKPKEVEAPKSAAAQKKPEKKDELITTSAEEMFCKFGLDAWFKPERLHPKVESLIYWRDVKKSGIVCGAGMVILLAMSCFSVISVFAYVSLLALAGTVAFRIYKSVMQAIQKTSEGHPFKAFMDFELQLPQEKVQQVTGVAVSHINSVLAELRRLFLVEDLVDSIKFGLMLWCLTYVGAWFNGMTLVILSYVALFTLPKVYETNKQSIDAYLDLVRSKINEITEKVKAAIPIGKKVESDKEK